MLNFKNLLPTRCEFWAGLALFGIFVVAYYPTLFKTVDLWLVPESSIVSAGWLVTVCCLYLLYSRKDDFRSTALEPNFWFSIALLSCGLIWLFGKLVDVQLLELVAIPALLLSTVGLVAGTQYFRLAFAPICILFFALPLWYPLQYPLQDLTTIATEWIVRFVGRPVFVQGNILQLPGGAFFVDLSCAGLRYQLVSAILCIVYVCLNPMIFSATIFLSTMAVLLSLVANWVRVSIVVLIGDATKMQSSLVEDHATFGWVVYFFLVLVPLFFIAEKITAKFHRPQSSSKITKPGKFDLRSFFIAALMALPLLTFGPVSQAIISQGKSNSERAVAIPEGKVSWALIAGQSSPNVTSWQPAYLGFDEKLFGHFSNGTSQVELHIYHYSIQSQNRELINALNQIADEELWHSVGDEATEVDISELQIPGLSVILEKRITRNRSSDMKLVWYWYRVGRTNTANRIEAKVLQFTESLRNRSDANLIAVSADCNNDCGQASANLKLFISDMLSHIEANL